MDASSQITPNHIISGARCKEAYKPRWGFFFVNGGVGGGGWGWVGVGGGGWGWVGVGGGGWGWGGGG